MIVSTESHSQIDQCAGDWFARRESDDWTAADQELFDRWLNESPLHRVAYLRIEHVWERAERLKALRGPTAEIPPPGSWVLSPFDTPNFRADDRQSLDGEKPAPGGADRAPSSVSTDLPPRTAVRSRRRMGLWALAASVLVISALAVMFRLADRGDVYRTPVGGLEAVPIADGSRVTLNTDSAIRVNLTARERGVELERGEAFFEVAHDPSRPFVVEAGNKRVIAVGTQFSVRREGDDIEVTVTEGTVRMEDRRERSGGAPARPQPLSSSSSGPRSSLPAAALDSLSGGSADVVLLPAGSVARAGEAGVLVQKESPGEVDEALSWRQGILVFHDMTLADAVAEFNRYNTRQIRIEDPTVAGLRIAGNFRATNVDAFVRLLEHGYPLRVEQGDSQVVLKAR